MKEIRILLENCDTITVDGKDVKFLDMEHISKLPQDINIVCQTTGQLCTTDRVTLILSKKPIYLIENLVFLMKQQSLNV